jgi:outer membrane protein TolC
VDIGVKRHIRGNTSAVFAACIFCILYIFGVLGVPRESAAASADVQSLSLAECIDIALSLHPSLKEARAAKREQEARLESLRVGDRITVGTGASYGYSTGSDTDSENSYSLSATGSKMIYDSGKNRLNKSAQQIAIQQADEGEADSRLSVVANVKNAYYDLLLAHRNLEVVQDQLRNLSDHLETAKGYYEVGARPLIDVTKAEVDVANARVSALSAEAQVNLAREALLVAMGSMNQGPFELSTPLETPKLEADSSQMTELALKTRPDYLRTALAVSAADIRVQSAARSNAPTVSANAGGSYGGREFPLNDNLSVGLRVDVPVYDAGERDAAVEIARSQRTQSEALLEAMTQSIVYEVRQAVLDLENAYARIRAAGETIQYAQENLELAQGRYSTGVGSPLEVSDAVSELSEARFTHYRAIYDAQAAVVSLEKATGTNFGP